MRVVKLGAVLSLCLSVCAAGAQDYDPRTNPQPPVRPLDRVGYHLGFPLATVTPMLAPEDTGGDFLGAVEHIETGYYGPPHVHYEKSETIIMTEGSAHLRVSGVDYTLTEGQWLHIPAGNVHSFDSTGSPAKWIILQHPGKTLSDADSPAPECDRSDFTPEMLADPEIMNPWYHNCVPDFYMVPDAGLPFEAAASE